MPRPSLAIIGGRQPAPPPALIDVVVVVVGHADETYSVEAVARYADGSVGHEVEATGLKRHLAVVKACLVAERRGAVRVVLPPEGGAQVRRRSW